MAALCAERGYAHVVISEVVARAAVSKATFYRFFKTKDECLFDAHKHYSAALLAAIDASCEPAVEWPGRLRTGVRAALEFCATSPDGAQLLTGGIISCGPEGIRRYRVMVDALAKRLRSGGPAPGRQAAVALATVVFAVPLITDSLVRSKPEAIAALEGEIVELIFAPITAAG